MFEKAAPKSDYCYVAYRQKPEGEWVACGHMNASFFAPAVAEKVAGWIRTGYLVVLLPTAQAMQETHGMDIH